MIMLTNEEETALRKKYFPRVTWTENGPVRRLYKTCPAGEGDALSILLALAERELFIAPGQRAIIGGAEECLDAFRRKAADKSIAMIFGNSLAAHWCDISLEPAEEGWQLMAVRSEEGENLVALAHSEGLLRFKRA